MTCFVCDGKAKKVADEHPLDTCNPGDPLYRCTECGAEWFSCKEIEPSDKSK